MSEQPIEQSVQSCLQVVGNDFRQLVVDINEIEGATKGYCEEVPLLKQAYGAIEKEVGNLSQQIAVCKDEGDKAVASSGHDLSALYAQSLDMQKIASEIRAEIHRIDAVNAKMIEAARQAKRVVERVSVSMEKLSQDLGTTDKNRADNDIADGRRVDESAKGAQATVESAKER